MRQRVTVNRQKLLSFHNKLLSTGTYQVSVIVICNMNIIPADAYIFQFNLTQYDRFSSNSFVENNRQQNIRHAF